MSASPLRLHPSGDVGGTHVRGQPVGIFGIIIVKAAARLQVRSPPSASPAQHRDRQLAPRDERLGEQLRRTAPTDPARRCAIGFPRWTFRDDRHPHARPFSHGLEHIGARQRIALVQALESTTRPPGIGQCPRRRAAVLATCLSIATALEAVSPECVYLRPIRRQPLHRSILARRPVQRVEHEIGRASASRAATSRPRSISVTSCPSRRAPPHTPRPKQG